MSDKLLIMNRICKCVLLLLGAGVMGSCAEEIGVSAGTDVEYRMERLAVDLTVGPMEVGFDGGAMETRAREDEGTGNGQGSEGGYPKTVDEFWFMEFTADGSRLVAPPVRYSFAAGETAHEIAVALPETGEKFIGVVIAGVNGIGEGLFNEENCATLEGLYSMCYTMGKTEICRAESEQEIVLYGSFDIGADDTALSCTLVRNVAKLTFTVNNLCPVPDFQIFQIRICNVPAKYHYFPRPVVDGVEDVVDEYVDYEYMLSQPLEKGTAKASEVMTFYVPRNLRAAVAPAEAPAGGPSVKTKNLYAPQGATYVEALGYNPHNMKLYSFKYYPGANMTDDFKLMANNSYGLEVDIRSYFAEGDKCINEISSVIKQLEPSNSYIINDEINTVYSISVEWLYKYWNSTDGYAESKINFAESDNQELIAEVIWQEQNSRVIWFCNADGENRSDTQTFRIAPNADDKGRFYVTKTFGLNPGNILIGVKRASDAESYDSYLWSWHLWITDYDPDAIAAANGDWTSDKYVYSIDPEYLYDSGNVPKNTLHRYSDGAGSTIWNETDGFYKNKYIMDRNLGAMSATRSDGLRMTGGLMYQFGRKEPFPMYKSGFIENELYLIDGVSDVKFTAANNDVIGKSPGVVSMDVATNNPHTIYTVSAGEWLSNNNYVNYLWNNPEGDVRTKGIFDPCPPGWMVPENGVWDVFANTPVGESGGHYLSSTTDGGYKFFISPSTGADAPTAYYPANSARFVNTGSIDSFGNEGYIRSSTPIDADKAYLLRFTSTQISPSISSHSRAAIMSLRCIQE